MTRWIKDRMLGWVLIAAFFACWGGQKYFHTGSSDEFWKDTFENWQSEFLQLGSFVILATYLKWKGSPQSRDGDDEMRAQLDRIEAAIKRGPPVVSGGGP